MGSRGTERVRLSLDTTHLRRTRSGAGRGPVKAELHNPLPKLGLYALPLAASFTRRPVQTPIFLHKLPLLYSTK